MNKLKNEVLDFLSTMKSPKLIQCQCGKPRQSIGFICDSCGEIVQPDPLQSYPSGIGDKND